MTSPSGAAAPPPGGARARPRTVQNERVQWDGNRRACARTLPHPKVADRLEAALFGLGRPVAEAVDARGIRCNWKADRPVTYQEVGLPADHLGLQRMFDAAILGWGPIRAEASSVEISCMIACPRCGWFADVPRDRENAVWAEHQRDPFCADVEPVHAPPASPYRARLCIKGHRRDAFGICWECLSAKAKMPLRARARHRNRTRRG
jgi:hypothetical protein